MANFPRFTLGTGATRWSVVTSANILHFEHGWKSFQQIELARPKSAHIDSWGDVLALLLDLGVDALVQLSYALPANIGTVLLIAAWLIETWRLAKEFGEWVALLWCTIRALLDDERNSD